MSTMTKSTEAVIAEMLVENTGSHMLDSGGHYGRHWQRNEGMTLEHWMETPEVSHERWGVSINVFHYLRQRVKYSPEMQEAFEVFAESMKDEPWLAVMEEFAEAMDPTYHTWNTYNYDDSLSQTLQGVTFNVDGTVYVLLQIHGGCDVRGGYTAPRAFIPLVDCPEAFPYDNNDYELHCPEDEEHNRSYHGSEWISWDGSYIRDDSQPILADEGFLCATCGVKMTAYGPASI